METYIALESIPQRIKFLENGEKGKKHIHIYRKTNGKTFNYYSKESTNDKWYPISSEEYYRNLQNNIDSERDIKELNFLKKFLNGYKTTTDEYRDIQLEYYRRTKKCLFEASKSVPPGNENISDNIYKPEDRIFQTKFNFKVRSKSELIICNNLFNFGIPCKYEPDFLDGKYTPDFIIEHNIHGTPIIWEHFGLMSNSEYVMNFLKKKDYYESHGFFLGVNFIASFEYVGPDSKSSIHFDDMSAENIIRHFLLP